jgi:hypothetical protein
MIWTPSTDYRYAFKKGMRGTDVAALQLNLKAVVVDGVFGSRTDARVREYQLAEGLTEDGIAGYATQSALCKNLSGPASKARALPAGFLASLMVNESGFYVAAVSRHPSDEGIDVGAYQRSSGKALGSQDFYASAYDVAASAGAAAADARALHDKVPTDPAPSRYYEELAGGVRDRFAWQMAALNHNWPAAAQNIPRKGHATSSAATDDEPASWVEAATAGRLHTPREWVMAYVQKATVFVNW